MWGKPDEAELQRIEWVKTLKEGDLVCYKASYGIGRETFYRTKKVKKVTPTGMVRLDDGSLWSSEGKAKGEGSYGVVLQPYTQEIEEYMKRLALRKKAEDAVYHLNYSRGKIGSFSEEDLRHLIRMRETYLEK